MRDVIIPPDLPLDAIAEEVQKTWKAKEVHVETLIQKVRCAALCHAMQPFLSS